LRMLAAPLRRYRRHGAFHDLQQRLLHALARQSALPQVSGRCRFFGDLVPLADKSGRIAARARKAIERLAVILHPLPMRTEWCGLWGFRHGLRVEAI
jgi:hypothetical protein